VNLLQIHCYMVNGWDRCAAVKPSSASPPVPGTPTHAKQPFIVESKWRNGWTFALGKADWVNL